MGQLLLTFSLRDRKQGQDLLLRLGWLDQELLTNEFQLSFEQEWHKEDLVAELEESDLEFELETL